MINYKFNYLRHKFGIENNYISMAMNIMLGKTNNTVKSMNVSETNAMVIDYNWNCILSLVVLVAFVIGIILFPIPLGLSVAYLITAGVITGIGTFGSIYESITTCF